MRFVFYRTVERCQEYRLEYEFECPDEVAKQIEAGTHPDYDTLADWAQDQDRDVYDEPDREVEADFDVYEGATGIRVLEEATP